MADIVNKNTVFGRLTVMKEAQKRFLPSGQVNRFFLCKCLCGIEKEFRYVHLKNHKTTSCGCLGRTRNGKSNSKLFKVWVQMKSRCNENYLESHLYFKKGIKVCDEWIEDYELFISWSLDNGYVEGLQIDRIDNSKGYFSWNCRWVSSLVNTNNRDVTIYVNYRNERVSLSLVLSELGKKKNYHSILGRIKRGMNPDFAIDTPIREGNYRKDNFKR